MEKTEEYRRYQWFLKQQYPRPRPCVKCKYWKANKNGRSLVAEHCDYLDMTGEKRGCLPDLENGKCERFERKKV